MTSNRNEYLGYLLEGGWGDKGGQCVRLTTLRHSCADCLYLLYCLLLFVFRSRLILCATSLSFHFSVK